MPNQEARVSHRRKARPTRHSRQRPFLASSSPRPIMYPTLVIGEERGHLGRRRPPDNGHLLRAEDVKEESWPTPVSRSDALPAYCDCLTCE